MPGENIVDLEGLLRPYLGPNKKIIDVKKERLTAPGENYCSLMLKLDITLENLETGKEEVLHAVAKTINTEVNEFFKKAAPPQFKKEIAFYTEIVPTLQEFQREQGITEVIDLFPKLYAARKNLHGTDDEVDDDCVIILENLKVQGYSNINRAIGFDLEGAKLVLKDLAMFHALPIALKMKQPEVFEIKVKKYCCKPWFPEFPKPKEPMPKPDWYRYLEEQEECKPYMGLLKEMWDALEKDEGPNPFFERPSRGHFVSIFHGDLWCNNTMQYQENGKLIKNKMVDFQMYFLASIICDVVFLIWSSVQLEFAKNNFEELLEWYHEHFLRVLEQYSCDTSNFTYSKFREAIEEDAHYEFLHAMTMAGPIFAPQGEAAFDTAEEDVEKMFDVTTTMKAKEKMKAVLCEFGERRWLKKLEAV